MTAHATTRRPRPAASRGGLVTLAALAALAGPAAAQTTTTTTTAETTPPPTTTPAPPPATTTAPPPARPATTTPRRPVPPRETPPRLQAPVGGAPTAARAYVARVLLPTVARVSPAPRARVVRRVSPYGPYDRDPQSLLVLESRRSPTGPWYRVLLPVRPNGTSGWVHNSALQVTRTNLRVRVDLSERRLVLLRNGRRWRQWTVAVGTSQNPTPTGLFAMSEIVPQTPASGFFGPFIMTLTAHSARLSDFDGGNGQVAIHGTSLPNLLGRAVSHGCVRVPNDGIRELARRVPRGAPVEIAD